MNSAGGIAVEGLVVRQGAFTLGPVSFHVPAGRYAVLMGRTGAGKTTLVETIAGLRTSTAGRIRLNGDDVTAWPPAARSIGYVPQDSAVFRTLSVYDNLAFALTIRRTPAAEIDARVTELADWLGLRPILSRRAVGLSGGEAQRVALGRALAFHPRVLLLDEPLSAVDETTREQLIALLEGVRRNESITVLHITHSSDDAERLGDVVIRWG